MVRNEQKKERHRGGRRCQLNTGNLYATLLYPNATQNANRHKGKNA